MAAISQRSRWERRIARAEELTSTHPAATELLTYYGRVARLQQKIFLDLEAHPTADPCAVAVYFPKLRELTARFGPAEVTGVPDSDVGALLADHWNHEAAPGEVERFIARVLLQPFAEALAGVGTASGDASSSVCPFCGALPFCSLLRGEGEGGKRSLVCSLCATEWEFRRMLCPSCGEENKDRLPVFVTPEFDYVRIEACEECHTYLKCIDLTRNGLAVAPADELATVALNVWAEEHAYSKLEPNLLGM